jgi:hypothetical protein
MKTPAKAKQANIGAADPASPPDSSREEPTPALESSQVETPETPTSVAPADQPPLPTPSRASGDPKVLRIFPLCACVTGEPRRVNKKCVPEGSSFEQILADHQKAAKQNPCAPSAGCTAPAWVDEYRYCR